MNYGLNRPSGDDRGDFDRRRPGRGGRGRGRGDFEHGAPGEWPGGPPPFGPGEGPQEGRDGGPGRSRRRRGGMGFGPGMGGPEGGFGPEFGPGPWGMPFGPGRHRGRGGGRARRGDVRLAILAILADGPRNGYQIIQRLSELTSGAWTPSPGAVYPALSQLTDEGLVVPTEVDGQKAFDLTESGREAAGQITEKPWEAVNAANTPVDAQGAATFWPEIAKLAQAARTIAMSGSPAQVQAATDVVAATRRKLYSILAEDDTDN